MSPVSIVIARIRFFQNDKKHRQHDQHKDEAERQNTCHDE
jgi:hypothetical protein